MNNLLAVDPATHGTAGSLFVKGKLVAAAYVKNPRNDTDLDIVLRCMSSARALSEWAKGVLFHHPDTEEYAAVDGIACELPQIYSRGANKTKGDPNKITLPLAMVNAALSAFFPLAEVFSQQPHSWKGTTQKPKRVTDPEYVILKRVRDALTPMERINIEWGKSVERTWDIADAIGVGLHHLGRFERARVFARE